MFGQTKGLLFTLATRLIKNNNKQLKNYFQNIREKPVTLRTTILAVMIILGGSVSVAFSATENHQTAQVQTEDARLSAFFEGIFERDVANSPNRQTRLGLKTERQGEWTDTSDRYAKARTAEKRADLAALVSGFDYAKLSPESQLSYDIFRFNQQQSIENAAFRRHFYVVDQFRGQFTSPLSLLQNNHKVDTRQDALDYISRTQGIEGLMKELVKQSQNREKIGVLAPDFAFPAMIADIKSILQQSPLKKDIATKIARLDIPDAEKDTLDEAIQCRY
jgi:uncharacterized protein (DUF885 family)